MKIIIEPVITEKSMNNARDGKYTFLVAKTAKKKTIKKVAEKMFNVHVVRISTFVVKGKSSRTGAKRTELKKSPFKKAVMVLKQGEKIPLFEAQ